MALLIQNKDQLVAFVPVARSIDFDSIKPEIEDAADTFLLPEIGLALLSSIDTNQDAVDEPYKTIAKHARRAVANFAMAEAVPKLTVNVTGAGITRSETEGEKSAFRYQEENLIQSYLKTAERSLENLLEVCEKNAEAISWSGPELTFLKENHLPTADAFQEFVDIGRSRRVFRKLKPFILAVQQARILSNIGNALNAKILEPEPTGHYWMVRHLVRQALSHLSFAEALPTLNVRVSEEGLSMISTAAAGDNALRKAPVPKNFLDDLIDRYRTSGETFIKQLNAYLNKYAIEIEEYATNSELYDPEFTRFKNDPNTGGAKLF